MGMYYQLDVKIILKPIEQIDENAHLWLNRLFRVGYPPGYDIEETPESCRPDHPFWKTRRFYALGYGDNANYAHPFLTLDCDINEGYEEIRTFLDWITSYVHGIKEPGSYDSDYHDYDENVAVTFEPDELGVSRFLFTACRAGGSGFGFARPDTFSKEWIKLEQPKVVDPIESVPVKGSDDVSAFVCDSVPEEYRGLSTSGYVAVLGGPRSPLDPTAAVVTMYDTELDRHTERMYSALGLTLRPTTQSLPALGFCTGCTKLTYPETKRWCSEWRNKPTQCALKRST